jgi:septal ring factor EnvC (AmiA/AmiB activator)
MAENKSLSSECAELKATLEKSTSECSNISSTLKKELASLRRELDEQRSAVAQSSSSSDELGARIRQLEVSAL